VTPFSIPHSTFRIPHLKRVALRGGTGILEAQELTELPCCEAVP
jgi:hypothetical protein